MVSEAHSRPVKPETLAKNLATRTRRLDALPAEELCIALLGSHQSANVMMLGYAFECGAIPLSSAALEGAIESLGVAVSQNLDAFRLGRAFRAHPDQLEDILRRARPRALGEEGSIEAASKLFPAQWARLGPLLGNFEDERGATHSDVALTGPVTPLAQRVAGWALDLVDYQNVAWGRRYLQTLLPVVEAEISQHARRPLLSAAAARELYRLLAYKDEYEVARLHLRAPFRRWLDERTNGRAKPTYWLHPPLLRALGMRGKIGLGSWFEVPLRALASLRFLRGTPFDPFGYTAARRLERDLIGWYETLLTTVVDRIESIGLPRALEVANCAALIRGYEEIKQDAAAHARETAEKLLHP